MTAEEIVSRLIDENKISGEEAIVLIKALLAKEQNTWLPKGLTEGTEPTISRYPVVMYGVSSPDQWVTEGRQSDIARIVEQLQK